MFYRKKDRDKLVEHANACVKRLQREFLDDKPSARADLAKLRREASQEVGNSPTAWARGIATLPEEFVGRGQQPTTPGELTMHRILTLYALHQQSLDDPMHQKTNENEGHFHNLGYAINQLAYRKRESNSGEELSPGQMPRRFAALVTANSTEEVAHYARQLIQLLRAEKIPVDYAALAGQLYAYEFETMRDQVRLEWSREFSRLQQAKE